MGQSLHDNPRWESAHQFVAKEIRCDEVRSTSNPLGAEDLDVRELIGAEIHSARQSIPMRKRRSIQSPLEAAPISAIGPLERMSVTTEAEMLGEKRNAAGASSNPTLHLEQSP